MSYMSMKEQMQKQEKAKKPFVLHIDGREVARLAWSAQNIPFDPAKKPDYTAILFVDTEAEAITTLIDYMRAKGYIVETKENTIIIHSKAAGG